MSIEVIYSCPFGHTCEKVNADSKIERCRLYTKMVGTHPQTGDPIDEWNCALAWAPVLQVELASQVRTTNATLQIASHEISKRQDSAIEKIQHVQKN